MRLAKTLKMKQFVKIVRENSDPLSAECCPTEKRYCRKALNGCMFMSNTNRGQQVVPDLYKSERVIHISTGTSCNSWKFHRKQ